MYLEPPTYSFFVGWGDISVQAAKTSSIIALRNHFKSVLARATKKKSAP